MAKRKITSEERARQDADWAVTWQKLEDLVQRLEARIEADRLRRERRGRLRRLIFPGRST